MDCCLFLECAPDPPSPRHAPGNISDPGQALSPTILLTTRVWVENIREALAPLSQVRKQHLKIQMSLRFPSPLRLGILLRAHRGWRGDHGELSLHGHLPHVVFEVGSRSHFPTDPSRPQMLPLSSIHAGLLDSSGFYWHSSKPQSEEKGKLQVFLS